MLERDTYSDLSEFNEAYLDVINEFFPGELSHFQDLNQVLSKEKFGDFNGTSATEIEQLFVDGTTLSGGFLVRKLGEDAHCFKPMLHCIVELGTQWRFLLAYLSAIVAFAWCCYKAFYEVPPQEVILTNDRIQVEVINKKPLRVETAHGRPLIDFPSDLRITLTSSNMSHSAV